MGVKLGIYSSILVIAQWMRVNYQRSSRENLVGYIRRNVCVPLPRVSSLEDLNGKLLEQCVKYLEHHIDGRPGSVGRMLEEDQLALQRLPKYSIDASPRKPIRP